MAAELHICRFPTGPFAIEIRSTARSSVRTQIPSCFSGRSACILHEQDILPTLRSGHQFPLTILVQTPEFDSGRGDEAEAGAGQDDANLGFPLQLKHYGNDGTFLIIAPLWTVSHLQQELSDGTDLITVPHEHSSVAVLLTAYDLLIRECKLLRCSRYLTSQWAGTQKEPNQR
jgi:hypothetical protein